MKPSFAKKLTLSYLFVVAVTLLITGAYLTRRLKANSLLTLEHSLGAQALLMRDLVVATRAYPAGDHPYHVLATQLGQEMGCRVTVVLADGRVVGDSQRSLDDLAQMDNHAQRPEIQAALHAQTGEAVRYSRTLKEDMLYVAVPVVFEDNAQPWGVIRVALPLTEVHRRLSAFRKDLYRAGAAALFIALGVAWVVARKTIRPLLVLSDTAREIGQGRFPRQVALHSRDEFGQLARAFSDMSGRIEEKVSELSRERTQLSAILAALVEGVVAVDHEGRVLFLNSAAETLFGVQSETVIGRPILEVLRHNPLQEIVRQTLHERKPVSHEVTLHSPQERILTIQSVPISYGQQHTGVLAALHDITALRKLEHVRQEFVANVSHELRTPLTAIKGYVETLLEGAIDDKKHNREFLKIIEDHAKHLSLLIEDVLDLSSIEAKRMAFHFDTVSLADVTKKLIKGLAPMAKAKDVEIINHLSEATSKVRADKDKLAQILMNLIDNAIKFNKSCGRVELRARLEHGVVHVSVQDTGAGIAAADLPRVFERFYRADKAHSHDIPGTGLGLAIVKHLVEAHQGTVSVESHVGQGSTFTFTLPAA